MRIAICVDTETLDYFSPGPWQSEKDKIKWKINKLLWPLRYSQGTEGIELLAKETSSINFPMTLFCVEEVRNKVKLLDWPKRTDIGSHGFSHKCLITMPDGELDMEFHLIEPGISFAAPMNKIEDINNKDRIFNHLRKKGFKIIRYQGPDSTKFKKQYHFDGVYPVEKSDGLLKVRGSKYFEGTSPDKHILHVIEDIKNHAHTSDAFIYCLSTHDFTWSPNNIYKLRKILSFIKKNFKVVTFKELVDE